MVDVSGQSYAALSFNTNNLGDEIQSIAAQQFLPWIDLRIDRDHLDARPDGAPESCKIILNGWYTHAPEHWPPAPFLNSLVTSFHVTREIFYLNTGGLIPAQILMHGNNLEYLRDHSPVGARDFATRDLLLQNGIDAHFSGCLTLSLGAGDAPAREDYVCAVDLPNLHLSILRTRTKSPVIVRTHLYPEGGFAERCYMARRLLSLYAHAKCVVTTRLHCALPCLALGTPVLFITAAKDAYRFEGLSQLTHHCLPQAYIDGTVDFDIDRPPLNPDSFGIYRTRLIQEVSRFVGEASNSGDRASFPFKPEPVSDSLLGPQWVPAGRSPTTGTSRSTFHRIFSPGRDYQKDRRPDFLRDIARVHADSGDRPEAARLLQIALTERPSGSYIKQLQDEIAQSALTLSTENLGVREEPILNPIVEGVQAAKLTYLGADRLASLVAELRKTKVRKVRGDFADFGLALGGSGICIASELEGARRYWGFGRFGMMSPPTDADGADMGERCEVIASGQSSGIGEDRHYGFVNDLYGAVVANFARFGLRVDQRTVNLVAGVFQHTLPQQKRFKIAFAHIDCDLHEHVKYCLDFVHDRLSRFGVVIADDYNDSPGCRNAVNEFCSKWDDVILERTVPHAVLLKL